MLKKSQRKTRKKKRKKSLKKKKKNTIKTRTPIFSPLHPHAAAACAYAQMK